MTQAFYQIGNDAEKVQYSGPHPAQALWTGNHVTSAIGATVGGLTVTQGDFLEIPLLSLPAGARLTGLEWAWDAAFANGSTTAVFYMRKKSQTFLPGNIATSLATVTQTGVSTLGAVTLGNATGLDEFGNSTNVGFVLAVGTCNGNPGVGALAGVITTPGYTAAVPVCTGLSNGQATILAKGLEGTTYLPKGQTAIGGAARHVLQEPYWFGLLHTIGTTAAPIASGGAHIYVGVHGIYEGTL